MKLIAIVGVSLILVRGSPVKSEVWGESQNTSGHYRLSHHHKSLKEFRLRRVLSGGLAQHELRIEKSAAFCGPRGAQARRAAELFLRLFL